MQDTISHKSRNKSLALRDDVLTTSQLASAVTTGLDTYYRSDAMPWTPRRAAHLLRRAGFGAPLQEVRALRYDEPDKIVDRMVDEAVALRFENRNHANFEGFYGNWLDGMHRHGLREKMSVFWHGHFVTEWRKYGRTPMLQEYLYTLRSQSMGNFKKLTHDVGTTAAMLVYLDGHNNRRGRPNENYARELLELFTMGLGHYTQQDITELARALTGWRVDFRTDTADFYTTEFDNGEKTFFGRTGHFGYDDAIDIIFEERTREIAKFICRKLYRFFVYDIPNESIVSQLADLFLAENFEVEPVLRTLLKSEHFFDEAFIGARIKSPLELYFSTYKEATLSRVVWDDIYDYAHSMLQKAGQELFNPPGVSGWPRHREWMSSTALAQRWRLVNVFTRPFRMSAEAVIAQVSDPHDPYVFAREIADHLLITEQTEEDFLRYTNILLDGIPDYEWDPEAPGAKTRVERFIDYLVKLPEYNLT